ncbi:MAG: hypothetical protein KKF62_00080 [Bacteroidetes bacterium]|nr:hypothetical protein [Bacteroidota bacterium]MBU1116236.1 hypothetical protein [Bacteroidota bacterium]MBU1799744.1 hypothetical protein [Bacteroidota bacterium]
MSTNKKYFLNIIALLSITIIAVQCTKENFVEPPDPFEIQKLDPNPEVLTLGEGKNAITLKTNQTNIINTKNGKRIKGSLYVENEKYGDIRLSNGDFELIEDSSTGLYFTGFKGESIITLPQEGLMKNFEIPGLTAAPIGFKKGTEFETGPYAWPVNENRYYFYYENLNPFPINMTSSALENIKKIAIDPTDPFFFISGDLTGTPLGDISDAGIAISAQGLIPFIPKVSLYDFPMSSFYGNLYITGNVPLGKYPASFTGETVLSFDSDNNEDSELFFSGKSADFILGLNGTVYFEHETLEWMGISVELGNATLEYSMNRSGDTELRFAGERKDIKVSDFINEVIGKDYDFLDYLKPSSTDMEFFGAIGTELSIWEMGFRMETKLDLPGFSSIDMGHAYLYINPDRMKFDGYAVLAGFSGVGVKGNVNFNNGHFVLTGYVKSGFSASCCKLSISYSLAMDVTLKYDGDVTFSAKVQLKGKACFGKLCASISIKASVSISSNGSYKICFSVGIGALGFDVCIDKKALANGQYQEVMTYDEIPLEYVPMENRFESYECD